NAATETEGLIGGNNNTIATAQDINSSFINLQTSIANAQRGAVSGTTDSVNYTASAVPFNFEDISTTGTIIAGLTNQTTLQSQFQLGLTSRCTVSTTRLCLFPVMVY